MVTTSREKVWCLTLQVFLENHFVQLKCGQRLRISFIEKGGNSNANFGIIHIYDFDIHNSLI